MRRPATLHSNTCTTRAIRTFLRHECSRALRSRPTSSGLELSVSRSEARYPTPLRGAPYTSRVNFTAQCLAGPTILFDIFRLVYALAQAFPADYFTAGIYTRPNSAEASAQMNRLEHVLRPPGTGWSRTHPCKQKPPLAEKKQKKTASMILGNVIREFVPPKCNKSTIIQSRSA